jgi:preprotein translocase subunit YajC
MLNVLLQTSPPGGGMNTGFILMMVAMIAIFYFFMIRPQQKRQKELQKARDAMRPGDKVVLAGGIHGRIKEIDETTALVEISDGVRVRVDKASVFASSSDASAQK